MLFAASCRLSVVPPRPATRSLSDPASSPINACSLVNGIACTSHASVSPFAASRSALFGPIPGKARSGSPATNPSSHPARTSTIPLGFP